MTRSLGLKCRGSCLNSLQLLCRVKAMRDERAAASFRSEEDDQPAFRERTEHAAQGVEVRNGFHPAGAAAQLAFGLWSAQQQFGQNRQLHLADLQHFIE